MLRIGPSIRKRGGSRDDCERWLDSVVARLTAVDLASRPERAVRMAINVLLDADNPSPPGCDPDVLLGVLQRTALFTTPITPAAVSAAYPAGHKQESVQVALKHLQDLGLLLRIHYEHEPKWRTTAHTPSFIGGIHAPYFSSEGAFSARTACGSVTSSATPSTTSTSSALSSCTTTLRLVPIRCCSAR